MNLFKWFIKSEFEDLDLRIKQIKQLEDKLKELQATKADRKIRKSPMKVVKNEISTKNI